MSEIMEVAANIEAGTNELNRLADVLEDRLSSVLIRIPEKVGMGPSKEYSSDLGRILGNQNDKLNSGLFRLRSILERLQI